MSDTCAPTTVPANGSGAGLLKTTASAAAGFTIVPRHVLGAGMTAPSDRLNIAGIGVGGCGTCRPYGPLDREHRRAL